MNMKIYFCDLCNESIPLQDLKDNRASTIKGKLFCHDCNPLNEVSATVSPGRTSWVVWGALGLGLAGLGILAYQVSEMRRNDPSEVFQTKLEGLVKENQSLALDLDANNERVQASLEKVATSDQIALLSDQLSVQREKFESIAKDMVEVREIVNGVQDARREVGVLELKQDELRSQLRELQDSHKKLTDRLNSRLDQLLSDASSVSRAVEPSDSGISPVGSVAAELDPRQMLWVKDLRDKDPAVRWNAVDGLADTRDPAIIPHIVQLLTDEDTFVQMRVVTALGELSARSTVKDLIPLLRDSDPLVRDEALGALVLLTGQTDLRFETRADANSREDGVKKWEIWYRENKTRFEG